MMTQAIRTERPRKITYEEFLRWDGGDRHVEWVDGEVIEMSPISAAHTRIGRFLIKIFGAFLDERTVGELFYDPFQMKTGPGLPGRAPDLLFIANENLPRLKKTYLDGPADLVVEIISPDDPDRDRVEKFHEYEQGGVREYWLIDPEAKQADFYLLGEDKRYHALPVEQGIFHSEVLNGLWITVDWLWREPTPAILNVLKEWGIV